MTPGSDTLRPERRSVPPAALRAVGVGVGLVLALACALCGGAPGALDRLFHDTAVSRLLPQVPAARDIVVVQVDDATLDSLDERWPLARATWARFFDVLARHAPAAVAVDVLFDQPGPQDALELGEQVLADLRGSGLTTQPAGAALAERLEARLRAGDGDARLAEALSSVGNVILGSMAVTEGGLPPSSLGSHTRPEPLQVAGAATPRLRGRDVVGSIGPLLVAARGTGTLNMLVDPDGIIRRYPYAVSTPGELHASLALATAMRLAPERAEALLQTALAADAGAPLLRLPAPGWIAHLSFADVLSAQPGDPALDQLLRDKVVFVGVTAPGLHGQVTLPGHTAMPGVEIHAFALENLRSGRLMRSGGAVAALGVLETLLVLAGLALLCERLRSLRQVLLAGGLLLALHLALAGALAVGPGWVLPVVPAVLGLGLLLALETALRFSELKAQCGALRRLFIRYPNAPAPHLGDVGSTD